MSRVEHPSAAASRPASMQVHVSTAADDIIARSPVPAESGLLDPEVPALARARRRAAERRAADFGIAPRRPAAAARS